MKFLRWKGTGPLFDANGDPLPAGGPVLDAGGDERDRWVTDRTIYIKCLDEDLVTAISRTVKPVFAPKVVALDPGHGPDGAGSSYTDGYSNPGASRGTESDVWEYNAAFHLAGLTKQAIRFRSKDKLHVELTKASADDDLSNLARARQAGDNEAAVFLSLHFDTTTARQTHCIALPEDYAEEIPKNSGNWFATHNFNQAAELALADRLAAELTAATGVPKRGGGHTYTDSDANKGVLFETCPSIEDCVHREEFKKHHRADRYDERLYHFTPLRWGEPRVLALILEVDSLESVDGDLYYHTPEGGFKEEAYQAAANAIAKAICEHIK